jgi:ketosteroid isomerase-like protein
MSVGLVLAQGPDAARADAFALMAETERAFATRAGVIGWRDAFLEYFAAEAVGFDQGAAGLAKEQIAKAPPPPSDMALTWEPRFGDMAGSGELGFLVGPSVVQHRGRPPRHQVYASVWQRQRDGAFKVVLDVGVPTPQAAPFGPGLTRPGSDNRFSGDYDERTPPLAAADGVLNSDLRSSQARAYRGRLAPMARLHRPNMAPVVGESRILAWARAQPRFTLSDSRFAESARSGDLGYTWGTYQLARPAAPTPRSRGRAARAPVEEGFYARVWTRERTGQWRVALDVLQPQ